MDRSKEAIQRFSTKLNCAQSVLSVYSSEYGIDEKTCYKIAEAFGGGIANKGKTCGTVIGSLMVIGLIHGRDEIDNLEQRDNTDKLTKTFLKKFEDKFQYTNCIDLINYNISTPNKIEEARSKNIFKNCGNYVKTAVEILEELREEKKFDNDK